MDILNSIQNIALIFSPLVIILSYFYTWKISGRYFAEVERYFKGKTFRHVFSPSFQGTYEGITFSVSRRWGGEYSIPSHFLRISLKRKYNFSLKIYKKIFRAQLFYSSLLMRHIKVGDEIFDKEFQVLSNEPNKALFLGQPDMKNAIRELSYKGFDVLCINKSGIFTPLESPVFQHGVKYLEFTRGLKPRVNFLTEFTERPIINNANFDPQLIKYALNRLILLAKTVNTVSAPERSLKESRGYLRNMDVRGYRDHG